MIDLSHLTEEEQGKIMMVLKRDAELKRAEEERIGKLQNVRSRASTSEASQLKYLTGEWFYEAKSCRHMDKSHGSEIILASMKQKPAGHLDGTHRLERPRVPRAKGPGITSPPKPPKRLALTQPYTKSASDAENEKLNLAVLSPGRQRHNPFNRDSQILVESPENTETPTTNANLDITSQTEGKSLRSNNAAGKAGQTSGAAMASEGSSLGSVRPVPKKRTFLSRRSNNKSESDSSGHSSQQPGPLAVVSAPRRSLQQDSSGDSNQSSLRATGEPSQKTPHQSHSSHPLFYANQVFVQMESDASQDFPIIGLDREGSDPSLLKDRYISYSCTRDTCACLSNVRTATKNDPSPDKSGENIYGGLNIASLARLKDPEINNTSSESSLFNQGNNCLAHGIMDQPVRYDLNVIDKHDPKKSNQKLVSKLSPQKSISGEEDNSIAKVLDWFTRSIDSDGWQDRDDSKKDIINTDTQGRIIIDDSLAKYDMVDYESRMNKREPVEIDLHNSQNKANKTKNDKEQNMFRTDGMEKKDVTVAQVGVRNTRAQEKVQEVKEKEDENQPHKICQLKPFGEKGIEGPKVLIGRLNNGQKPTNLSMDKEREGHITDNKPLNIEMPSVKGDNYPNDERAELQPAPVNQSVDMDSIESVKLVGHSNQQIAYTPKKGTSHTPVPEILASPTYLEKQQTPLTLKKEDQMYNAEYVLQLNSQNSRRDIDTKTELSWTKHNSQPGTPILFSLNPEYEPCSAIAQQEQMLSACPNPQLKEYHQAGASPDYELVTQFRSSPYRDNQSGGNVVQFTPKAQMQRGSIEDVNKESNEDRSAKASLLSKIKEKSTNNDRSNSPHSQKHQETTADKIKQLKSFWEKEFYTDKSKACVDGKGTRGSNLVKLNKRFTKSEYDLKLIGKDSDSDVEDTDGNQHKCTVVAMNQRQDKSSPSLGTNRAQFKNLREFWNEAFSNRRGPPAFDTPKSPKRKDQMDSQASAINLKQCIDPDFDHKTGVSVEKSNVRPTANKSSSPSQNRSKSPSDRQTGEGSGTENYTQQKSYFSPVESAQEKEGRRGSKDSPREEKSSKIHHNVMGKENRFPKTKKDRSGRANTFRRSTSMFSLNATEEPDQSFDVEHTNNQEVSPGQFQSRRPSAERTQARRQSGIITRRESEDSEPFAPRARVFVPRDYRHYLGMTEKTSVHTSLAPAVNVQGSEGKIGHDLDLSGPVRASTPVGPEERFGRRGSKTSQCPLWVNNSGSETGRASSVSSTSETWSNSRNNSSRGNEEDPNPVKRALWRAEVRPRNLAKSLEGITASVSPRQERRLDETADLRHSDAPSVASPPSSFFSDPEHMKKMSKSVPSFLQNEAYGTDSTFDDIYHGDKLKMGRSNHTSGMASASRLSDSVMTMYSGDFGNVEVQGNIEFSINYIQKLREFHIFVAWCRDLAAVDPKRGRSDPYVKSYLVPDIANLGKRKTSVKKKTLNPIYNEILRYRVRMEYLRTQTLILSVWHHDTFGKNSFLGEVDVDLSKWDFDHTHMNYLALKARTTPSVLPSDVRGEMRVAIRFLPQISHTSGTVKEGRTTGEVHIWVKDCKNLPLIRATIDPYVKCVVLPDTSRKGRQKTRVLHRTADPVFNHTMVYDGIRQEDLIEACVELTVWDRDILSSHLLGGLRLGPGTGSSYGAAVDWMDSTPYEVALWERMMYSPNEWVEEVLPMRILTPARTALK